MTRTERTIVLHWRGLLVLCAIVALFGISLVLWHRIDTSDNRASAAAAEANRRGSALTTVAGDVRALRAQVKSLGKTPVAPDPAKAVDNLPARTVVPVPIPGPTGKTGPSGAPDRDGVDGAAGSPGVAGSPGAAGPTGPAGVQGEQGPPGPAGPAGQDGKDGADGRDGQTCPDGYSLQAPSYDPDALVCRRDGAPQPGDSDTPSPQSLALDPQRRQYA
jgi:hypothetical protein